MLQLLLLEPKLAFLDETDSAWTWTRCPTVRTCTSPGLWSTSKKRASTRATPLACCLPIRCPPRPSPKSNARPWLLPRNCASSADEYPVRGQGRGCVHPRSEPPRFPYRAVRLQGHGRAPAASRHAGHARQDPQGTGPLVHAPFRVRVRQGSVFPFRRFPGVDILLGPEMRSTGEVMGIAPTFEEAFLKGQWGAGQKLPEGGKVFLSVNDRDKRFVAEVARQYVDLGFELLATSGTAGLWLGRASRPPACSRCTKAARTSSTSSRTAKSRWSSTPPRASAPRTTPRHPAGYAPLRRAVQHHVVRREGHCPRHRCGPDHRSARKEPSGIL